MKKVLSVAVLSLCVLGTAASASAYFDPGTLTQVVYQEVDAINFGTVEYGTDLGNVKTFDVSTASNYLAAPVGNVTKGNLNWSDLRLAYFASNYNGTSSGFYFATTSPIVTGASIKQITPFDSAADATYWHYDNINSSGTQTVLSTPADLNSYDTTMNGLSKGPGQYAGLNSPAPELGEANLGALDTQDYVDMYLYKVGYDGGWKVIPGNGTDYVAKMQFNADGSTIINPTSSPVPVPTSVLLFGSGLLGLFGFRRKES